jgi:hypothetical protein
MDRLNNAWQLFIDAAMWCVCANVWQLVADDKQPVSGAGAGADPFDVRITYKTDVPKDLVTVKVSTVVPYPIDQVTNLLLDVCRLACTQQHLQHLHLHTLPSEWCVERCGVVCVMCAVAQA